MALMRRDDEVARTFRSPLTKDQSEKTPDD
jgi:hypothetical protein